MKRIGMVLGVAAVATLAGCKDPDYKHAGAPAAQNEVKQVDTQTSIAIASAPAPKCKCPPGTKHTSPCFCGGDNCMCLVEAKTATPPPPPAKAAPAPVEPETTVYIVQSGDYLAKISKRFNVTINSIRRVNPQIKKDLIRVGQKIKIPGRVDVGEQKMPAAAVPAKGPRKSYQSYTGATKEYVVKNGDTLGAIAYGNGCNIRQLKELNGLTKDSLRVGQKIRIPADAKAAKKAGKAAAKAAKADAKKPAAPAEPTKATEPAKNAPAPAADAATAPAADAAPAPAGDATPAPAGDAAPAATPAEGATPAAAQAPAATATYIVQEGDDMTGVSIRFGVSASAIRELNNLSDDAQLTPGQVLKLPADAQQ